LNGSLDFGRPAIFNFLFPHAYFLLRLFWGRLPHAVNAPDNAQIALKTPIFEKLADEASIRKMQTPPPNKPPNF